MLEGLHKRKEMEDINGSGQGRNLRNLIKFGTRTILKIIIPWEDGDLK